MAEPTKERTASPDNARSSAEGYRPSRRRGLSGDPKQGKGQPTPVWKGSEDQGKPHRVRDTSELDASPGGSHFQGFAKNTDSHTGA